MKWTDEMDLGRIAGVRGARWNVAIRTGTLNWWTHLEEQLDTRSLRCCWTCWCWPGWRCRRWHQCPDQPARAESLVRCWSGRCWRFSRGIWTTASRRSPSSRIGCEVRFGSQPKLRQCSFRSCQKRRWRGLERRDDHHCQSSDHIRIGCSRRRKLWKKRILTWWTFGIFCEW